MARRRHRSGRSDGAPAWLAMLCGLAMGLAVAYGVYLHGRSERAPAPTRAATAATPTGAAGTATATAPQPSERLSDRAAEAARFDFYEILPQFEVVIPEVETAQRPPSSPTAREPVAEPGSYVLQAGSFTATADADRRQASLALLGIESRVQRVTIDDRVFHRVRIGPITDLAELDRVRERLRDARIDTLLMRVP